MTLKFPLGGLSPLQQYAVVTAAYWMFTLSDGALRMLVVFHFHQLGFSTLEIAALFIFYEVFGIITNLAGGWIGARSGLRLTLWLGLLLQIGALLLLVPVAPAWPKLLAVPYVMAAQALSGVAKDLSKMSAKGSIKAVLASGSPSPSQGIDTTGQDQRLFRWVALLTGSKNALKGVGFFLGGVLLAVFGFAGSVALMAAALAITLLATLGLPDDLGRMKAKISWGSLLATGAGVQVLSLARFFLFGARDVWFVVALPVFLEAALGWRFWEVGGFLGLWVIGYGLVQGAAPSLRRTLGQSAPPGPATIQGWSAILAAVPALIAVALWRQAAHPGLVVVVGLVLFGAVFAMASSIHSYLVLAYAETESVSLAVGFYYMANAAGRLVGTLLSGWMYQVGGMTLCLSCSALMVLLSWLCSLRLPPIPRPSGAPEVLSAA